MHQNQPKYFDKITLIALVLMLICGGVSIQRFLTPEQPGLASDEFGRVR